MSGQTDVSRPHFPFVHFALFFCRLRLRVAAYKEFVKNPSSACPCHHQSAVPSSLSSSYLLVPSTTTSCPLVANAIAKRNESSFLRQSKRKVHRLRREELRQESTRGIPRRVSLGLARWLTKHLVFSRIYEFYRALRSHAVLFLGRWRRTWHWRYY